MADEEFLEKLRSLHVVRRGKRVPKTTTDVHDHHQVDVTEHWDDRVDVNVKLETFRKEKEQ